MARRNMTNRKRAQISRAQISSVIFEVQMHTLAFFEASGAGHPRKPRKMPW